MTTTTNTTDANKALVLAGIKGVFIDRDPTVLELPAVYPTQYVTAGGHKSTRSRWTGGPLTVTQIGSECD